MACLAGLGVFLAVGCGQDQPGQKGQDPPVWNESSQSITVTCFAFFEGSMRFTATRDLLSANQLDLLSNLRTIDAVPGCWEDVMGCQITVGQGDGGVSTIDSIEMNSACDRPRKILSFESFDPFRRSLGCQYAKNLTYSLSQSSTAVLPDARCFNGLFTPQSGGTIAVGLKVDDAGPARHIELDDCDQPGRMGKLTFSLFDSDGTTALATSTPVTDPGTNHACASLDYNFGQPGLFNLSVVVAPDVLPAGDFFLRFY